MRIVDRLVLVLVFPRAVFKLDKRVDVLLKANTSYEISPIIIGPGREAHW